MQQNEALILLKMGANVFLTGAAGSGKTYLLNQYIKYLKENNVHVAITASTGIAATHLHGTTIHSWSGIGLKESISQLDLEKLHKNRRIKSNYKKTKVLIIDEISMLHKYQLDMVDFIARNFLDPERVFGGLQVIVCGDFFQLPPVSSSLDEEKQFAYEASVWNNENFQVCYLHEQHRQGNDPLLTVLNDIRNGTAGEHTKVPLRTRYKKEPFGATKATKLYTRNINVDSINDSELANIQSQEHIFTMVSQGFSALVEGLKRNCLAQEQLKLKIGAEVMFIKNHPMGKYVNGTRCVVVGFEKGTDAWPVVKTYDNKMITACAEDWVLEDNGIVRASITQVPLRLAWALTIHKSQGMTLDAAEIDLGDAFEPGMGYVALSRIRSLNGLKLINLNEMALKVHPKILQHDRVFKDNSAVSVGYLHSLSEEEKLQLQHKTLFERFEAHKIKKPSKKIISRETNIPTHLITLELLKNKLSINTIAGQRELSSGTILNHIEKLKGLKLIDNSDIKYLKDDLSQNEFDLIFTELTKSEDGKLKPLVEAFSGKYSYETIKLVRLFY
jgi:ATP-dependent DNA helicase PIF1